MGKVIDAMFLGGDSADIELQALIAAVDDIVFVVNAKSVFLNVWARDERILFMPKEDFLNKPIYEVMGPLAPLFEGLIDKVLKTGEVQEVSYKHIDPEVDKHYRVRANLFKYNEDGAKCKIALTVRDITADVVRNRELTKAQQSLYHMQDLLSDAQRLSNTGSWDYDIETGDIYWTEETYRIYNLPVGTKIDYELDVLTQYIDEDNERLAKLVMNAIEKQEPYETVMQTRTGRYIHKFGMPIIKDGKVIKLRGAVRDVTDKIESRKALEAAKEAAEKAAKAKTDFLSIMSHEIRTPLNGIIGIANLLEQNKNEEQSELIDSLIFSSNHLLKLVNDILDLNKIESDKLDLNVETVNLRQLLKNINTQFGNVAKAKGLELLTNVDEQLPEYITADPVRISQMLNNLVGNALKFTEKGSVTTSVQQQSRKDNKVTIHFSVKDTGIGIPDDQIDAVFESFNQVKQDQASNNVGTGLGLTITKRLVALHDGEIKIKSKLGEGTEFFFDLTFDIPDVEDAEKAATPASVSEYKDAFAHLKVLLVEDNPVNVLVARKQLEHFGIATQCVSNGKEALALMKQGDYDLVLTDIHMPEMDGFELSAHIRKSYPRVHIVGFTADITPEAKERMAQLGIYDILSKPFAPKQMLNILLHASELQE